jgi:UDP-3-O-[3-hydroxymyristoyl] glucosamine N-acyltransferase
VLAISLDELAVRLGAVVLGDGNLRISGAGTLRSAGPDQVTFLANPRYRQQLAETRAAAVVLAPADRELPTRAAKLVCANPYAAFAEALALLHPPPEVTPGIHPTAQIDPSAQIAASACIGPHCVIGRDAIIGDAVVLEAMASVGAGSAVGAASRLHPRVSIYAGCRIGQRAIIHSGAVIGADGFGFAPEAGAWRKIPQVGGVWIGDDVEIGANTTIDRGALEDTVIEDGVKLDNQIQIGHNVLIGAHSALAGCVGVAGSARIGRHCRIGGGAVILGHLEIADGVTIQAMSLVTHAIREAGEYSSVWPAMPHREWLRTVAAVRRLPSLSDKLRGL